SSDDAAASNGLCNGVADGSYCGGDQVSGDPSLLFQCSGGNLSAGQPCDSGCTVNGSGGDACALAPDGNGQSDGQYCGNDGLNNADPNTLYQCTGGALSVSQVCDNGCAVGAMDVCN